MTDTAECGVGHPRPRAARVHDPLLKSKITVPSLPRWAVSRPRLDKLMAEGVQGPLTVVVGPPGAGKTMAIASWAAGQGCGPVAWVTLDDYDNRPRIFWSYVVAALRQAGIDVSGAVSALARGAATGYVFLLRLASALATHDPPVILVLDDLHVVTDPAALAGLAYVLRNASSGLHLVVASRQDPLLPLHQYRLTGDLTEIRTEDLAFTAPEAALLMAQHGVTLPGETLEFVTKRGEGWAAGLRMAAISMDRHPDPHQFVQDFVAEDSAVAGYLVQEVLNVQPAGVRELLLRTSILDRVNADIASELMEDKRAGRALAGLAQENAFVQSTGHGWFRYHCVLRDVLRLKMRREQPSAVTDIHRRAARWYQRNGCLRAAVRHAGEAGDWPLAARIVVDEFAVGKLIDPHETELPAAGFRRVAEAQPQPQPQTLLAAAAVALPDGRDEAAGASLAAAERVLAHVPHDQELPSRFGAAAIRLALARRHGDFDAAADAAASMDSLFQSLPLSVRARHAEAAAQVLCGRGIVAFWSGGLERAAGLLDHAVSLLDGASPAQPRCDDRATCRGYLALLEALRGRLNAAAELAATGTVVPESGHAAQPCPAAAVALALVHLERAELNGARGRLKAADAILRAQPDKLIAAIACLVAARVGLADGHPSAAADMLGAARDGWQQPPWLNHLLTVADSQVRAAAGDTQAAVDTARHAQPGSALDAAVALARAHVAAGDLTAARQALHAAAEMPPGKGPDRTRLDAWLAEALVSFRAGDPARGRRSLERALRLGEPERLRLPFAVDRGWIRPALQRHPELVHAHRNLLEPTLAGAGLVPPFAAPQAPPPPVIVEQLSARERDVLRGVAEMLSTAEIAAEMYISVNTVKTHLKSIFRKLGAADRREAARRAKKLGLLSLSLSLARWAAPITVNHRQSRSIRSITARIHGVAGKLMNADDMQREVLQPVQQTPELRLITNTGHDTRAARLA